MSPNVAWSGSLESYHPYLQVQKVSKIPKIECTHGGLPKIAKSHFGCLRTLGVKKRCYDAILSLKSLKNFRG
jgi:hypothetical protein